MFSIEVTQLLIWTSYYLLFYIIIMSKNESNCFLAIIDFYPFAKSLSTKLIQTEALHVIVD